MPIPGAKGKAEGGASFEDELSRQIVAAEASSAWTLMHRFNKAADLLAQLKDVSQPQSCLLGVGSVRAWWIITSRGWHLAGAVLCTVGCEHGGLVEGCSCCSLILACACSSLLATHSAGEFGRTAGPGRPCLPTNHEAPEA